MQTQLQTISTNLPAPESIIAINFIDKSLSESLIFLTATGDIFSLNLQTKEKILLYNCKNDLELIEAVQIYPYKNFVAFVNNKNTRGFVFNLETNTIHLHLTRGDYQVGHCSFPIGFYTQEEHIYLIHGTDWNRLDITCLTDANKLLTDRIVKYGKDEESINYLDYFHSLLYISPDEKQFIVNGWMWSPYDVILHWRIDEFLNSYETIYKSLNDLERTGYNWDRPLCWIDETTMAFGYNATEAEELKPTAENNFSEFVLIDLPTNEIINRIPFKEFYLTNDSEVKGNLHFDQVLGAFIYFHRQKGFYVINKLGEILLQNEKITQNNATKAYSEVINDMAPLQENFVTNIYSEKYHAFLNLKAGNNIEMLTCIQNVS